MSRLRPFVERDVVTTNQETVSVDKNTSAEKERKELEELRAVKRQIDKERGELPSLEWINQQIDLIDALLERGRRDCNALEAYTHR